MKDAFSQIDCGPLSHGGMYRTQCIERIGGKGMLVGVVVVNIDEADTEMVGRFSYQLLLCLVSILWHHALHCYVSHNQNRSHDIDTINVDLSAIRFVILLVPVLHQLLLFNNLAPRLSLCVSVRVSFPRKL